MVALWVVDSVVRSAELMVGSKVVWLAVMSTVRMVERMVELTVEMSVVQKADLLVGL